MEKFQIMTISWKKTNLALIVVAMEPYCFLVHVQW